MEVSPAILEFKGPFTKPSTEKLVLTNTSAETLAFKVKTTAPKLYCVRPNASIIQPGTSLEVSIISQGLKEEPAPDFKCKDKFLLVTLPCPYDDAETKVAELWPALESEFKATSKKIKVNYLIDASASTPSTGSANGGFANGNSANNVASSTSNQSASEKIAAPVKERSTEGAADSSFATTHQQIPAHVVQEDEISSDEPKSSDFSKNTNEPYHSSSEVEAVPAAKGGIPIPLALILAILAFLIGKFFL